MTRDKAKQIVVDVVDVLETIAARRLMLLMAVHMVESLILQVIDSGALDAVLVAHSDPLKPA